MLVVARLYLL